MALCSYCTKLYTQSVRRSCPSERTCLYLEAIFLATTFDPTKRPEENLAAFFVYLKQQDEELGQLLESHLKSGAELSAKDRAAIAKQAVVILQRRAGGGNNA